MERKVQLFLAERVGPAMTDVDVRAIHHLLFTATQRLSGSGTPVQLVRSTYLTTERRWIGTFTADAAESVHRAVEIAQLPTVRVTEAMNFVFPN
jgi:hypothetical protein